MEQNDELKSPGDRSNPEDDALSTLLVFDSLEIGPVKLESRKLTVPYRLKFKGGEDSLDLAYNYEEDVLDPQDESMQNLASMIGAQIAINYGLFCEQIVFNGSYDDTDRRFIQDAIEITAREIYVNNFLANKVLGPDAAGKPPATKKQKYSRARIVFSEESSKRDKLPWRLLTAESDRHCILFSGGTGGLLSYGLLHELGKETRQVLFDDSGRQWLSARNAYNYFRDNVTDTNCISVNSKKVFNWILGHITSALKEPLVVASREFPIHQWETPVYLFATLPIMRKRNIGRLVIGHEYALTDRTSSEGITHYNGSYDKSRYFDDALSRYYMRKGWNITQFSVLRPLSDMLVQKILVQRYPELAKLQVSCQSPQERDKKVYPCGKCDACQVTVGMMTALGLDAHICGYTDEQINTCLVEFTSGKIHPGATDSEHLYHLLKQKGIIDVSSDGGKFAREHAALMKLRFHPEKSSMNSIPVELRMPLYRIFLEYADGAVRQVKRKWVDIDPFTDPAIIRAYPFEMAIQRKQKHLKQPGQPIKVEYLWAELTWPEAEKRLQEVDVAMLPVGSIEQHGPHLTLDVDAFDAEYLARRVADACSDPQPLVLPTLPYGVSYHHEQFPGTLSISNETLSRLVYEVGMGAAKNGVKKLIIINGHGGNSPALNYAAQMINRDSKIFACVDTGETSDVDIEELVETPNDVHAGEIETSTSLATRPHLVKMDLAMKMIPEFSSRYLNFTSKRGVSWYAHTEKISSSGVMGDPTKADVEKGKKMWEIMIAHLVAFIEDLKSMTLDEIHQKRY